MSAGIAGAMVGTAMGFILGAVVMLVSRDKTADAKEALRWYRRYESAHDDLADARSTIADLRYYAGVVRAMLESHPEKCLACQVYCPAEGETDLCLLDEHLVRLGVSVPERDEHEYGYVSQCDEEDMEA